MNGFADTSLADLVTQLAWLFLGAALVGMLARWTRVPYAVALVLAGLLVEESHVARVPQLEPGVLLFVLLPPLLFDASFRSDTEQFGRLSQPILVLALPGTLVTAGIVAVVVWGLLGLPPTVALLFGSIVAATDPVAVLGIFRGLRAPARLATIAEGESLVNDGVAIALYATLLGLVQSGGFPDAGGLVVLFGREIIGGVAVGAVMGLLFSRLTAAVDDHLVEMTLSTALAYGSYLVAQSIGGSGALACVAAGLVHGSYGRRVGMSVRTSRLLDDLWEYLGFLANAVIFLLVGLSVNLAALQREIWPVTVAVLGTTLARVLVTMLPGYVIPERLTVTTPPERLVLAWCGLRGALTIALALALPQQIPERDLLIVMAFGVVLFTLLVQGLTLPLVLRRTGLASVR